MSKVLFNNQWLDPDQAQINLQSDALMYGLGLFETLRTYSGKSLPLLDKHIQRLFTSLETFPIEIKYQPQQIAEMVQKVVAQSEHELQRIKIVAIPEGVMVSSHKLTLNPTTLKGITLKTTVLKRAMPEYKSTAYADCYISWQAAQNQGFFDALLIDTTTQVYESTRANIFWITKGQIVTRQDEILPGIIRSIIINDMPQSVKFSNGTLDDLFSADEVFITNSIIGIAPVIEIDGNHIGPANITNSLINELQKHISSR